MKGKRWESRLLLATYALCLQCLEVYFVEGSYDKGAIVMAVIIACFLLMATLLLENFFLTAISLLSCLLQSLRLLV